jgi:hypothetical protein
LISTNLVETSFCGITPVLLYCEIDRTTDVVSTFWQVSTGKRRKEERNIEEPREPKYSRSINIGTLPSHRFTYTYYSNHV